MPAALLIIGVFVVLAVLMILAINRYATGHVTCALTGLKLEERPKSKVVSVKLPVEGPDGQIAYVKHDVIVNETAAVLFREQGMPAFRQTLRFLEPDSLVYMMNASHNFFMPARASKVFAFLHQNGPEGYDQAFDDYLREAYGIAVEPEAEEKPEGVIPELPPEMADQDKEGLAWDAGQQAETVPEEAPTAETGAEAEQETVVLEAILPQDEVAAEWEGLGAAGKTLEQEVAGLEEKPTEEATASEK